MELDIGGWKIRSWRTADEDALVRYANNRNVWVNLLDSFPFPYTRDDARAWIQRATTQHPESSFAIASDIEAIGGIGLHFRHDVYRRSAEVGYWIAEPFWGQGIATKALRAFTVYAFTQFDLIRLYAGVFEWNAASMRVLEKAGYVLEGRLRNNVTKDGKTIDQYTYAILRQEPYLPD